MSLTSRVAAWAVRKQVRASGTVSCGGRLYWMGEDGQLVDLGSYTARGLATVAWAVGLAYRLGSRDDRHRLAPVREQAGRLAREAGRLTKVEGLDGWDK